MTALPAEPVKPAWLRLGSDMVPVTLLLVATVAALWPVCRAQFVAWDDHVILYQNPTFNPPAWSSLPPLVDDAAPALYTPVAYTVWGMLAWLAHAPAEPKTGISLNPHVFHTANLILHLLTATVAYFLLKQLLNHRWAAAAGALLFAIHPVQVESVAHASGIQGLLCGLFGLLAVHLYVLAIISHAHLESPDQSLPSISAEPGTNQRARGNRPNFAGLYTLATLAFVLALLSKPAAMTVPLLAAVLHAVWLRCRAVKAGRLLGSWLLLALPAAIIVRVIQKSPAL